jgi:uncharacterized membrane protein required for colicin V production
VNLDLIDYLDDHRLHHLLKILPVVHLMLLEFIDRFLGVPFSWLARIKSDIQICSWQLFI